MEIKVICNFRYEIAELMKKYNVNQATLCKEIGLRDATLSDYLHNKINTRSDIIEKILNYFLKLEAQAEAKNQ